MCDVYCEAPSTALLSCSVMTLNIDLSGNILFLFRQSSMVLSELGLPECFTQMCSSPFMSICRVNQQFSKLCP